MSLESESLARIEQAIAEHAALTLGDQTVILTGWVVAATHVRAGADHAGGSYTFEVPDVQATHVTMGLLELARIEAANTWRQESFPEGED